MRPTPSKIWKPTMDLRRSLVFRSSNACSTFKCSQSIQDIYIYIQLVHPSRTFYSRIQKNLSRGCHILPCFSFPSICSPMFSQCSFSKLHGRHSAGHFPHLTGPVNPMAGIPIAKKHYTAVIPPKHTYHHWWSCILYIYITVIGHSEIGNR